MGVVLGGGFGVGVFCFVFFFVLNQKETVSLGRTPEQKVKFRTRKFSCMGQHLADPLLIECGLKFFVV